MRHLTGNVLEGFDGLVDVFEGVGDATLHLFGVYTLEHVVHPRLVPFHPIRSRHPQVSERLEVSQQFVHHFVLQTSRLLQ